MFDIASDGVPTCYAVRDTGPALTLRQIKIRYATRRVHLKLSLTVHEQVRDQLLTWRVCASARIAVQRLPDFWTDAPANLPRTVQCSLSATHHQAAAAQTPTELKHGAAPGAPGGAVLVTALQLA